MINCERKSCGRTIQDPGATPIFGMHLILCPGCEAILKSQIEAFMERGSNMDTSPIEQTIDLPDVDKTDAIASFEAAHDSGDIVQVPPEPEEN